MKTPQEVFDIVLRGLRKQGKASKNASDSMCLYRAPDGCKCAVGHLIPDDLYNSYMEGQSARKPFVYEALVRAGVAPSEAQDNPYSKAVRHVTFLARLQSAHDVELARHGMKEWEGAMANIATAYGLEYIAS